MADRPTDMLDLFADHPGMPPVYVDIRKRFLALGSLLASQAAQIADLEARLKDGAAQQKQLDRIVQLLEALDGKIGTALYRR